METILDALKGTPWWVYVIFAYLIRVGVKALKPQTLSVLKMIILPLIFLVLSILTLIFKYQGWQSIVGWALLAGAGFFIGSALFKSLKVKADRKKLLVHLPGSRLILILVLSLFAVKYFLGYFESTHEGDASFVRMADIVSTGLITGIFVGRFYTLLKKFSKAKHQGLKKNENPRRKKLL